MEQIISSSSHHDHHQQPEKTKWSWEENGAFENALVELDHDSPDLFEQIAVRVPGKTPSQVQTHYSDLVEDIQTIESDLVPLPNYGNENTNATNTVDAEKKRKHPRKKGILWTPEEHELFLMGLEKYGKGDWKSISRYCVVTRTPAQVASHAQKYFLRVQNSGNNGQNSDATITAAAALVAPSPLQYMTEPYTSIEDQFFPTYNP
ncbi:hypothetical protein Q3G72_009711 [Acer saccharum]|nr:hypothetical protein Q3G72_009711 [Acer saccharum]